jgi:threonine/homoserine/homoserine lactone efflux protein
MLSVRQQWGGELDSAVGGILTLGIGVAISPVPIIAVILMLFSKQAKGNGLAFALGWALGLALVGTLALVLVSAHNLSSGGGPSIAVSLLELLLGLLLLCVAVGQWRKRPKPGAEPTTPAWMATLDWLTPAKAPGLAALLSGANPKNLSLTLAAAVLIARANLPPGQAILALAVFISIGSITVAGPVLYYLVAGERAAKTLDGWKAWLTANNATVMAVLLLVIGTLLAREGIGGLSG